MPITTSGINLMLDAFADVATYVALFNGNPNTTGTEVSGGSYSRQLITWNDASNKNLDSNGAVTFSGLASGTVFDYVGIMTAVNGGTLMQFRSINQVSLLDGGDYVVNDYDILGS